MCTSVALTQCRKHGIIRCCKASADPKEAYRGELVGQNEYKLLARMQFGTCATCQWTAFECQGHVCPGIPGHLRRAEPSRPETVRLPLKTGVLM